MTFNGVIARVKSTVSKRMYFQIKTTTTEVAISYTDISWEAKTGRSMRCPSRSRSNSFSTGTDGYGLPPSEKISHNSTPYDQLDNHIVTIIYQYHMLQKPVFFRYIKHCPREAKLVLVWPMKVKQIINGTSVIVWIFDTVKKVVIAWSQLWQLLRCGQKHANTQR